MQSGQPLTTSRKSPGSATSAATAELGSLWRLVPVGTSQFLEQLGQSRFIELANCYRDHRVVELSLSSTTSHPFISRKTGAELSPVRSFLR